MKARATIALLVLFLAALSGCRFPGIDSETGSISIVLPAIGARSVLPSESDIARFDIEVKSDAVGYTETFTSASGGIVTIGRLVQATYSILVEAVDANGEIIMRGSDFASVYVGEVSFVEIVLEHVVGYLDIDIALPESDLDAYLEIGGIQLDPAVPITVVHGPGIFIERLFGGLNTYRPGLADMKVFSVETSGVNAANLQEWFDQPGEGRTGVLRVLDRQLNVRYRWNMTDLAPRRAVPTDGGTQLYFSVAEYDLVDPPADLPFNYNESTDKLVETEGIQPIAAEVRRNETDNTLTLVFGYERGLAELYGWVSDLANGIGEPRTVAATRYAAGGFVEVGRADDLRGRLPDPIRANRRLRHRHLWPLPRRAQLRFCGEWFVGMAAGGMPGQAQDGRGFRFTGDTSPVVAGRLICTPVRTREAEIEMDHTLADQGDRLSPAAERVRDSIHGADEKRDRECNNEGEQSRGHCRSDERHAQ